jgi:hypothetical protein
MGEDQDNRAELLRLWHEYGKAFNVFVPAEQPDPRDWDRPLETPDEKGILDPQALKHWRYFEKTRDFLRERYADHGILASPGLIFDCLVPKFQKPLDIPPEKRKQYKMPRHGDPPRWYAGALRMLITSQGEVGFVCNSEECQRTRCKLNLRNEKRISPCDLFSLIHIFHGQRSVAKALAIVAEEFGKLGKFKAHGVEEKPKIIRYAVPKHEIHALIARYAQMRRQHVPRLVREATDLIRGCALVELEHGRVFSNYFAFFWPQIIDHGILARINGPAIKLYLWLLVRQEEAARRNQWGLELTDAQVAREWGATRKAIGRLRQALEKLGLLRAQGGRRVVGYSGDFQGYTPPQFFQYRLTRSPNRYHPYNVLLPPGG